jgi:hypothetical protein
MHSTLLPVGYSARGIHYGVRSDANGLANGTTFRLARARTSKCRAQRELLIGATNHELHEGSFIRSRSGWISLQSPRRPDGSRKASRRVATRRAAGYETSVPGEKLVYPGWAKLSQQSTATSVSRGTILTGNAPEFLEQFRSTADPIAVKPRSSARISARSPREIVQL